MFNKNNIHKLDDRINDWESKNNKIVQIESLVFDSVLYVLLKVEFTPEYMIRA